MSLISTGSVGTVARSTVLFAGGNRQGYSDGAAIGAKFAFPQGVAIYKRTVVICDTSNHVIRTIDEYGATKTLAGMSGVQGDSDGQGSNARFNLPHAVCMDSKGNALVTDHGQLVRHITPDGVVTTLWDATKQPAGTDPLLRQCSLRGITCTHDTVYMTCTATHSVISLSLITKQARIVAGGIGSGFVDGKCSEAKFHSPHGIDCDDDAHLYVSDTANHCIRKITIGQSVTTFAGDPTQTGLRDGVAAKAQFSKPYGLCLDRLPAASAQESEPSSFAVFVCDGPNKAVRRIAGGEVRTVSHLDFEPYDVVSDDEHSVIVNAPWIHQFHKLNLDAEGKVRASMDAGSGGANFSASLSGSNAFSRMGTTQSLAGGPNGAVAAALLSAPIETRITFNFGDAKSPDTTAPIPGMKTDRELSLTPSTPRSLMVSRAATNTSAGGNKKDGGSGSDKEPTSPTSPSDDKPPLLRDESTDITGSVPPLQTGPSPFAAPNGATPTATNGDAKPTDDDNKQCRMCNTACVVM